eukprot:2665978-Rhodomonas_salina.1
MDDSPGHEREGMVASDGSEKALRPEDEGGRTSDKDARKAVPEATDSEPRAKEDVGFEPVDLEEAEQLASPVK